LAGTWRYYVALELQSAFKDEYKKDLAKREEKKDNIKELFNNPKDWMKNFSGNRFARIKCAGQDEEPQKTLDESKSINTGHCGHCIVCKAFGYSKKDKSWQGMLFFSDLNIVFFPVYTRFGVRWITSKRILKEAGLLSGKKNSDSAPNNIVFVSEEIESGKQRVINLGWLNLPYEVKEKEFNINLEEVNSDDFKLVPKDIVIVPDSLISQIINSNLEVRTSVSIDPITGAAKEGALFTSEAIPRGTVFYGKIRLFDKKYLGIENDLPDAELIWKALEDAKKYYEIFGIGGMTTRGFGRMKVWLKEISDKKGGKENDAGKQDK
ncbi:MAG: hypothetical protein J7L03_05935, partial [Caldisericaceae bacterium]|nr:hypothetical protein [Caldisericaceae bacterium]